MLPVPQIPFSQPSSQTSLYGSFQGIGYSDISASFGSHTFAPQSLHDASFSGVDLNSPDVFKQNIHLVLEQLARVQTLARSTITGMFVLFYFPPGSASTEAPKESRLTALE